MPKISKLKKSRRQTLEKANAVNPRRGRRLRPRKEPIASLITEKSKNLPSTSYNRFDFLQNFLTIFFRDINSEKPLFNRREHLRKCSEIVRKNREKKQKLEKQRQNAVYAARVRKRLDIKRSVSYISLEHFNSRALMIMGEGWVRVRRVLLVLGFRVGAVCFWRF